MDKKELLKKLLKILGQEDHDSEQDHIDADTLLLEYIDDMQITKLFWELAKWHC